MTTVLAVYNSDGCVGRCDANCHDAKSAHCTCICGGKNHGAGLQKAIENNHERVGLTAEDLERYAREHGFQCDALHVIDRNAVPSRKSASRQAREQILARIQSELPL